MTGPKVNLCERVTSPIARHHIRKLYRHARRSGSTPFDARVLAARAALAVACEGDETFGQGLRVTAIARRVAVQTIMRGAA